MSKIELIVAFFTIIYGLMLAKLLSNFDKLIRARKRVKWNWIPLVISWFLLLLILKNWWSLVIPTGEKKEYNIVNFLFISHIMFFLYLLVSVILPRKIPKEGINLKKYYFKHHKYFWGLMSVFLLILFAETIVSSKSTLSVRIIVFQLLFISSTVLLTLTKKYWIHSVCAILFTLAILSEIYYLALK